MVFYIATTTIYCNVLPHNEHSQLTGSSAHMCMSVYLLQCVQLKWCGGSSFGEEDPCAVYIRIPSVKYIASSKSTLIATQDYVYKLEPRPYDGQILSCIDQKQFELALCLAVSWREGSGGGLVVVGERAAG